MNSLFAKSSSDVSQRTGGTELLVLVDDVVGVVLHEDLTRRTQVEHFRMITEFFTQSGAPDQTAVGVDVDLADAHLSGFKVFVFIHTRSTSQITAGVVDAGDPFLRNAGRTVHDEREVRLHAVDGFLDLAQDVEMQALFAGEFERTVGGSDSNGERVAAGRFDEFHGIGRIRQLHGTNNVFFNAAELTKFSFHDDAFGMGAVNDAFGDLDVLFEFFVGSVDHDGGIETAVDAVVADFFRAVVKVNGENGFRERFVAGADQTFEDALVGVTASAAGDLDDERSSFGAVDRIIIFAGFAQVAAEKPNGLFHIVDVVCADGVFAVSLFEQFGRGNDHGKPPKKVVTRRGDP